MINKKWKATSVERRVSGSLLASRFVCLLLFLFSGFPLFAALGAIGMKLDEGRSALSSRRRSG
jgi:hypothetical protein